MLRLMGIFDAVLGLMWTLWHYPYFVREMVIGAMLAMSGFFILWLDAERRKQSEKGKGGEKGFGA